MDSVASAFVCSSPAVAFCPVQAPDAAQSLASFVDQLRRAAEPFVTVPGVALSVTLGTGGGVTVTCAELLTVPPGPEQTSSKTVDSVSDGEDSEPDSPRLPLHPPDAVHEVALLLLQDSCVAELKSTLVGVAVKVAVGGGGAATAMLTDPLASPPGPEQVSAKVVPDVNAGVDSAPDWARLPLQPPDALQAVALVLAQESCATPP